MTKAMILKRCLHCLLLVGGVSALCLLWTFPQKRYNIQEQRKTHLQQACNTTSWRNIQELSASELKHFIVDDKHGIIYCYVPKVACTNWKRVFYVLSKGEPYPDFGTVGGNFVHSYGGFTLLSRFPMNERKARLKHYTKFLFVRDPFVRLISAYKNKIEALKDNFYKSYVQYMLRHYAHMAHPPDTRDEAFKTGIRPTFNQFVQYLIDPATEKTEPFEPHWRQMHRLCHPCSVQYDFIGHQETLQEDADMLLKMVKLDHQITFPPSPQIPNSENELWDWFKSVPLEDRRRLYSIYELDFRLFGYTKPHLLLDNDRKNSFIWSV